MKYNQILFASDLTDASNAGGERAALLAKKYGAKLDIIHVIEHSPIAYGGEFSIQIDPNLEQSIEGKARAALDQQAESLGIPPDHQYLFNGVVKTHVLDIAKQINADLIILGTHSHHGLEALLGSRANAILHGANCDVLTVRTNSQT